MTIRQRFSAVLLWSVLVLVGTMFDGGGRIVAVAAEAARWAGAEARL